MIKSPIQKVTNKLQHRAIGIVAGVYEPLDPLSLNKGIITDEKGSLLDSVILGKAIPIIKKYIDLKKHHYWIVYPRNKDCEKLHLQIAGIWDPYTLDKENNFVSLKPEELLNSLNLRDNFFSIRGQLVFINQTSKEIVIKVSPVNKIKKLSNKPFKVVIKGEIPMEFVNNFVSLEVQRNSNTLSLEKYEVILKESSISYASSGFSISRVVGSSQ